MQDLKLANFLVEQRISEEDWAKSALEWDTVLAIAADFESLRDELSDAAAFHAKILQGLHDVHSVRWRVKDTTQLISKIIRKRANAQAKYSDITVENYFEKVTDLVGLRALHLFKSDGLEIHRQITRKWDTKESPIAYVRKGDPDSLSELYGASGIEVRTHDAGYRSIHYVINTKPLNRSIFCEIQVRTIFEEGWSEIDHSVRYPNYSDHPLVFEFLTILNGLAGNADQMASSVKNLVTNIEKMNSEKDGVSKERDSLYDILNETVAKLEQSDQKNTSHLANIFELKRQIGELRSQDKTANNSFSSQYKSIALLLSENDLSDPDLSKFTSKSAAYKLGKSLNDILK